LNLPAPEVRTDGGYAPQGPTWASRNGLFY
jgi:hypothetical protein